MSNFGIDDLERYSDIKSHTLRAWEYRYRVSRPNRSQGNYRYYSLDQLLLILQIALLNQNGHKISYLSSLLPGEIELMFNALKGNDNRQRKAVIALIVHMYTMNTREFEAELDKCFISWQANEVLTQIIYPFLKKTNLFWQGKRLTEEHLVVIIIRKKLIYAIEKLNINSKGGKKILLFLPDSTQLDLALLFASYRTIVKGMDVVNMGNDVSTENLKAVFTTFQPDYIYTYLHQKNSFHLEKLYRLMQEWSQSKLVITLQPCETTRHISDQILFENFDQAMAILTSPQSE